MYFIDVQGTLIDDENRLPIFGAIEFINLLNEKNIPYIVITNNTKMQSEVFLSSLNEMGLNINEKNYIDPFMLLKNVATKKKVAAFGQDSFLDVLPKLGYELDFENPQTLLVSIKKEYTNEDYSSMIEAALKTDDLIGMHETSIYSKDGCRYPGVGSIMQMIKFATNKEYQVVGKPSIDFYTMAKEKLQKSYAIKSIKFSEITIISDDFISYNLQGRSYSRDIEKRIVKLSMQLATDAILLDGNSLLAEDVLGYAPSSMIGLVFVNDYEQSTLFKTQCFSENIIKNISILLLSVFD